MTLTELLASITNTKAQMKQKLGTSSDVLPHYPTYITNYLNTYYNNGYKAGWKSVTGTAYSGNKKSMITPGTVPTTFQNADTTQLSTLTNIMSAIADIRNSMKSALGISSNSFSTYPDYLDSSATSAYNLGYTTGASDASSSTPQKSPTPLIFTSGNSVHITCSSCTGLTWWITDSPTGEKSNSSFKAATSVTFSITPSDAGKYVRAYSNTNGMNNSDIATSSQLVYTPEEPVLEVPDAPTITVDTIENKILITSTQGAIIVYTLNGGSSWIDTGDSSVELLIRPAGYSANNVQAYCYFEDDPTNHSATYIYSSAITYTLTPAEPELEDITTTPFYICATNMSGTYKIQATEGAIGISTNKNGTGAIAAEGSGTYTYTLQANTIYYLFRNNDTLPNGIAFKLVSYTGGMRISFGGNLMSFVDSNWNAATGISSTTTVPSKAFQNMFTDTNWKLSIYDISNLYFPPAGGTYAYSAMFMGCTALTVLPAEIRCGGTMKNYQFYNTFKNCTAITKAPSLPATTLGMHCYNMMFQGCTALTTPPSQLPATTLPASCYYHMFYNCTKLTASPSILATDISNTNCMGYMFYGCSVLKKISVRFTTWPTDKSQTTSWCGGSFSSSGTFEIYGSGTWKASDHVGVSGIPSGWTVSDRRASNYYYYTSQVGGV